MSSGKLLAVVSAMLLSACASSYPPLVSIPRVPPANAYNLTEIDQVLASAEKLQGTYAIYYLDSAQTQDLSQIPLIGAAAFAALILLDRNHNAATDAGRVGIAAGTYSAMRGQFTSPGLVDAYIAGHGALTCLIAEGSMFSGTPAGTRQTRLQTELQAIATAIRDVVQADRPVADAGNLAETLRTTRAVAAQAITAARAAETAALTQQGYYENAAPIFRIALTAISQRVVSRGRVRPVVEAPPAPPAAPKPPEGAAPNSERDDVNSIIRDIVLRTSALVTATARLTAVTPPYKESLDRVKACPDQIH